MSSTYHNPVLRGFFPDPSIVRVGNDYYMANSTFHWFPAIVISHSTDLVNWTVIGHGISDPAWFDLRDISDSHGIWAPDISWHDGVFYLYATLRLNNPLPGETTPLRRQLLVKATDPRGPWSKPVYLDYDNIDSSHFMDTDGRHWMVIAPGVNIVPLSDDGERITGPAIQLWEGTGRKAPEGPHLLRKDGWYYAILAEGGTGFGHCITVARSRTLLGPYEACPHNPILQQQDPASPIQRTGHGKFFQTPDGDWWVVYLCGRNNGGPFTTLGRETALDPLHWDAEGWPHINRDQGPSLTQGFPRLASGGQPAPVQKLPTEEGDHFDSPTLDPRWNWLRTPDSGGFAIDPARGLTWKAGATPPWELGLSNALFRRETEHRYEAAAQVHLLDHQPGAQVGLLTYYGIHNMVGLCLEASGIRGFSVVDDIHHSLGRVPVDPTRPWILGVSVEGQRREFWYAEADDMGTMAMPRERRVLFNLDDCRFLSDEGVSIGKHHTGTHCGIYAWDGTTSGTLKPIFHRDLASARWFLMDFPGRGSFVNPVIHADYSDPDVIRHGDEYWMVASSFAQSPGLPILRSRDLAHWNLVAHALGGPTEAQGPDHPLAGRPAHGRGVWAPSMRFHHGWFHIYWGSPDEGIFMVRAPHPAGPWSSPRLVKRALGWIDPCPFWDDDGQAWLVNGFANSRVGFKSVLRVSRMSPDGMEVLDEGAFVFDGGLRHQTMEGPKLHKRNGWYYIFAPAGGVGQGWQTVLRSRNILGPYEDRIILHQGDSAVNGPHQGSWVEAPDGTHWFIHFQDRGAYGRVVHLQPMTWVGDWPRIGVDTNNDGIGEPVAQAALPAAWYHQPQGPGPSLGGTAVGADGASCSPGTLLPGSDPLLGPNLSLAWQWQGAPVTRDSKLPGEASWSVGPGGLALRGPEGPREGPRILDLPTVLGQKITAPALRASVSLAIGDRGGVGGLAVMGRTWRALELRPGRDGGLELVLIEGSRTWNHLALPTGDTVREEVVARPPQGLLDLGVEIKGGEGRFRWRNASEAPWEAIGPTFTLVPGLWIGATLALFARTLEGGGGPVRFRHWVLERGEDS